jgi:hypothetical protein
MFYLETFALPISEPWRYNKVYLRQNYTFFAEDIPKEMRSMSAIRTQTQPGILSRHAILASFAKDNPGKSHSAYMKKLQQKLKDGSLVHVGRDAYQPAEQSSRYEHAYSQAALKLAAFMSEEYPLADGRILEFTQYNEFVNHLLGHNTILLSVEKDIMSFIFDALQEQYPSKVLLHPSVDDFHLYRQDDAIIVEPLLTESPRSSQGPWQTGLEKLLVDLLTDKYLRSSISESEYPLIYETAFERYTVDERKLFRYARRRNAAQKIRQLIKDKTSIELRTETTC